MQHMHTHNTHARPIDLTNLCCGSFPFETHIFVCGRRGHQRQSRCALCLYACLGHVQRVRDERREGARDRPTAPHNSVMVADTISNFSAEEMCQVCIHQVCMREAVEPCLCTTHRGQIYDDLVKKAGAFCLPDGLKYDFSASLVATMTPP